MTQKELKALLRFDPATGKFWWLQGGRGRRTDRPAGGLFRSGYAFVTIGRKRYFADQLAWLYVYGTFLDAHPEHINGERSDNRLVNLREAMGSENAHQKRRDNTSGHRGVSWYARSGKWAARIRVSDRLKHLGYFGTKEQAAEAYRAAVEGLQVKSRKHH